MLTRTRSSGQSIDNYKDQTDIFYASPLTYLRTRFPSSINTSFPPSPRPFTSPGEPVSSSDVHDWKHEWPEYLVMFGALLREPGVEELLQEKGYRKSWNEEYGWEGDDRRRGGIVVLKARDV